MRVRGKDGGGDGESAEGCLELLGLSGEGCARTCEAVEEEDSGEATRREEGVQDEVAEEGSHCGRMRAGEGLWWWGVMFF